MQSIKSIPRKENLNLDIMKLIFTVTISMGTFYIYFFIKIVRLQT